MKQYDFTFPGGMLRDQEWLAWWQSSWRELAEGLAMGSGHLTGPYSVGGALPSFPAADEAQLTQGWIFYEGELIAVRANLGLAGIAVGNEAYVLINDDNVDIPYNDSTTHTAKLDKYVTLESYLIGSPEGPTQFKLTSLKPYGRQKDWTEIPVAAVFGGGGGVDGSIWYKKDFLTNTLLLRGELVAGPAISFVALPILEFNEITTLPPGYIPATIARFFAEAWFESPGSGTLHTPSDTATSQFLQMIRVRVMTDGKIMMSCPEAAVDYNIDFNVRISLD
jgi:hypothetical protein